MQSLDYVRRAALLLSSLIFVMASCLLIYAYLADVSEDKKIILTFVSIFVFILISLFLGIVEKFTKHDE